MMAFSSFPAVTKMCVKLLIWNVSVDFCSDEKSLHNAVKYCKKVFNHLKKTILEAKDTKVFAVLGSSQLKFRHVFKLIFI